MFRFGDFIFREIHHNDSFNPANNLAQTQQLLDYGAGRKAIMAGDFNSNQGEPSIDLTRRTGNFRAAFAGPLTFPSGKAEQKIDFIFAPSDWELVKH